MKRPLAIQQEFNQIGTVEDLVSIFEAIASIHIGQIRDKVLASTDYFNELWQVYSQLRLSKEESKERLSIQKGQGTALVAITSDSGLIGDIDERILQVLLQTRATIQGKQDLFVLGAHGASLLRQRHVQPTQAFPLPDVEKGSSVQKLAELFGKYEHVTVYYQTYISLMRQDVAHIDLFSAVRTLGEVSRSGDQLISSQNYIFEPSVKEIISYMESVMVGIALGQVLLESQLAQYASRFNAMYAAKAKAKELRSDLGLELHRAKRAVSDERIKEVLSGRKLLHRKV